MLTKLADLAFLFAIPVHSHYGMCACVTDYFPNKFKRECREHGKRGANGHSLSLLSFVWDVHVHVHVHACMHGGIVQVYHRSFLALLDEDM